MSDNRSQEPRGWLDRLSQALSGDPRSKDELRQLLRDCAAEGVIDNGTLNIMEGALSVGDMHVREIMVPRSQMITLHDDMDRNDILAIIRENEHSRYPVLDDDNPDEVQGILLAKDFLAAVSSEGHERIRLKDLLRPAIFCPESKRLTSLLQEFRAKRNHMIIVVNEFGSVAGLATIEDVLEQIVGEIDDEHDTNEDDDLIKPLSDNEYTVKALTPVDFFNDFFHSQFDVDEFDTIGGVVTAAFEHLPARHETITLGRFCFTVVNADSRVVRLLKVTVDTN